MFRLIIVLLVFAFTTNFACADDEVEFLSGAKVQGKVKAIRKEQKEFDFEVQMAGRTLVRTYPYTKVHAGYDQRKAVCADEARRGRNDDVQRWGHSYTIRCRK